MNLEGRKNNVYFDKTGKQILPGDLLKVYHFGTGRGTRYMYHVAIMEETKDFPVMALRSYMKEKPHYRLFQVCNNPQRVYFNAEVVCMEDWETPRKRIKVIKEVQND